MKNISQLMKQAQEMQSKMAELQDRLEANEATGQSGGGMVQVTVNGKQVIKSVKIDPALVDPAEIEVLEDLIVAAANDARTKMEAEVQQEMQGLTGGLSLPPGMKLPF
ncbi:MAG: YbaB/EbfC family nucleoid-associated protein [Rhodospirillales bacterium]